jgi:hypothetical protein
MSDLMFTSKYHVGHCPFLRYTAFDIHGVSGDGFTPDFRAEGGGITFLQNVGRYLPSGPHGVTTQKTNIDILSAVRTSNLVFPNVFYFKISGDS